MHYYGIIFMCMTFIVETVHTMDFVCGQVIASHSESYLEHGHKLWTTRDVQKSRICTSNFGKLYVFNRLFKKQNTTGNRSSWGKKKYRACKSIVISSDKNRFVNGVLCGEEDATYVADESDNVIKCSFDLSEKYTKVDTMPCINNGVGITGLAKPPAQKSQIVVASSDNIVRIWDLNKSGSCTRLQSKKEEYVDDARPHLSYLNPHLIVQQWGKNIALFDSREKYEVASWQECKASISYLSCSPNGEQFLSYKNSGEPLAYFYDIKKGTCICSYPYYRPFFYTNEWIGVFEGVQKQTSELKFKALTFKRPLQDVNDGIDDTSVAYIFSNEAGDLFVDPYYNKATSEVICRSKDTVKTVVVYDLSTLEKIY